MRTLFAMIGIMSICILVSILYRHMNINEM